MTPENAKLEMKVQLTVIEDLGIKLYGTLPPVLSEVVANSWDADASWVKIDLPTGEVDSDTEISIEDDGEGMTFQEVQESYLQVGRKKRLVEGREATTNGRPLMGRKGIGKLAVFGVAGVVVIETIKDNKMSVFKMVLEDILEQARTTGVYNPVIICKDKPVQKKHGTTVRLTKLKRKSQLDIDSVRKSVAKHFSIIGEKFVVSVNRNEVTPADKFKKEDMQYLWEIDTEEVDVAHPNWTVSGWIGTMTTPVDELDRGVVIRARGKLFQTPTTFDSKVGERYSYSYIVGELNAEFIDLGEDLITSNRQSAIWDSPEGMALKKWGKEKLSRISDEWTRKRRENRERVIRDAPGYKDWLENLPQAERKVADKVIGIITGDEKLDDEKRLEMASFMKESFDQKVFHQMVANLGEDPDDSKLIEVFMEWDIIEAREILGVVKGRLTTISQLQKLIDQNAREVPTIHQFFQKWPWILEPTWTKFQHEVSYSKILKEKFTEEKLDEPNRRIDFVCIGVNDTVNVIELKRPGHTINKDDLLQLIEYVAFVKENLGTTPERGYRDVSGYIVGGEKSTDRAIADLLKMMSTQRLYLKRYNDLVIVARQLHSDFEKKIEEFEKK